MTDAVGTTLPDTSGNGYNGTLVNGPVIGAMGIAFTKASEQYISLPPALSTQVQTIEIYADCDRKLQGTRSAILGSSSQFALKIYCSLRGDGTDTSVAVDMGTALTTDIDASATTITLNSSERMPAGNYFSIESESVLCNSLTGNVYSSCSRGMLGTSAASHLSGAPVLGTALVGGPVSQSTSLFASYFSIVSPSLITAALGTTNSRLLDGGTETMYGGFFSAPTPARPFTVANNVGQWQLGGDAGEYFSGTIYYVLMYSDQESNANISQNSTALAPIMRNRGIPARTDGWHPGNIVVCEGSSIEVYGPWCKMMTLTGVANSDIMVTAQSGGLYQNITQYTMARDGPLTNPLAARNIMFLGAPTNDLVSNSVSGTEAVYARVVSQVRAAGYNQIYCGLMLSRTGTGFGSATMDVLHDQWNAWLTNNYSQIGCSNIIAWDSRFTGDGAWNNPDDAACDGTPCFSDGVHPTDAGFRVMSALASSVINGAARHHHSFRPVPTRE